MTTPAHRGRAEFEAWASDNGAWPRAVERDFSGNYTLLQTHASWGAWQAAWQAARRTRPAGRAEAVAGSQHKEKT